MVSLLKMKLKMTQQWPVETDSQNNTIMLAIRDIIEPPTYSVGQCEPSRSSCPWLGGSGTRSWSGSRSTGGPRPTRSGGSWRCTLRGGTPAPGVGSARWRTWCAVYGADPPCDVSLPLWTSLYYLCEDLAITVVDCSLLVCRDTGSTNTEKV